jgi:hypothetical protein
MAGDNNDKKILVIDFGGAHLAFSNRFSYKSGS